MSSDRLSFLDSPLFLGFDHFEEMVNRMRKAANEGYPPYNIEQIDDYKIQITLAVAGFSMDDLDVEIEQNQLVIRGKQQEDVDRVYLYRGIAARQFQRSFVLAEGLEVKGALLDNGLLHIHLEQLAPDVPVQKIKIMDAKSMSSKQKALPLESSSASDS